MKKLVGLFPLLLLTHLLTGCKGNEVAEPKPDQNVDLSTVCSDKQLVGGYQLFYKPQQGFVGDPMPYFHEYDRNYYLFYLYENATRHPIYLTKTTDFASFQGFTEVVPSGAIGSQDEWIGTGSFIKNDNLYYCFYTGHNGKLTPAEKVMVATSHDLLNWTKQSKATFQAPAGYDADNFRDPHVYWDETVSKYVMLITTRKDGKAALARFSSSNLDDWSLMEPLVATSSDHPAQHEIETDAELLECPDIFKMGDRWYLTFSRINRDEHRKTFYRIADSPAGPWRICRDEDGHHETFDGLYLYAGKTVTDGLSRYLSGWCSTAQTRNNNNELAWSGSLITHKLVQQPNGRLYPTIPDAVDAKFNKAVAYSPIRSEGNTSSSQEDNYTISASSADRSYVLFNRNKEAVKIEMKIDASQSVRFGFSFGACGDLSELYSISFDLTSANRWGMPSLFMYQENSSLATATELNFTPLVVPSNKMFDVKIIIENSICVVYVNNNVAFTNRMDKMYNNPWTVFSDNGTIKITDLAITKAG